jgi:hypothetical protein
MNSLSENCATELTHAGRSDRPENAARQLSLLCTLADANGCAKWIFHRHPSLIPIFFRRFPGNGENHRAAWLYDLRNCRIAIYAKEFPASAKENHSLRKNRKTPPGGSAQTVGPI